MLLWQNLFYRGIIYWENNLCACLGDGFGSDSDVFSFTSFCVSALVGCFPAQPVQMAPPRRATALGPSLCERSTNENVSYSFLLGKRYDVLRSLVLQRALGLVYGQLTDRKPGLFLGSLWKRRKPIYL